MKTFRICMVTTLLVVFGATLAHAQNTYEDLNGRFTLDLPAGWKLAPQKNEYVYQFTGDGSEQIVLIYLPDADDRAELFSNAVENMQSSVADAAPQGDVVDLDVNGNPARWGIYSGTVKAGGTKVIIHGLLGSVVFNDGGIYFVSFLNDNNRGEWEEPLTQVFQSIREVDAEVSGATSGTAVETSEVAAPRVASTEPTQFEDKYVTATLPPGWRAETFSAEMRKQDGSVVKFESDTNGNIVVGCFSLLKRMFTPKKNGKTLYLEARNMIRNTIPTAETVEGPLVFKNEDGKKITFEIYQGYLINEGEEIPMHALHASGKTKRCKEGLTLYGFVGTDTAEQAIKEMMEIVRSVR